MPVGVPSNPLLSRLRKAVTKMGNTHGAGHTVTTEHRRIVSDSVRRYVGDQPRGPHGCFTKGKAK